MPLSQEFSEFYTSWLQKANQYTDNDIRSCFDKFFTLFVVYNRLYAEATFRLAQTEGSGINLDNWNTFPDPVAAKEYLANYIGARNLINGLRSDPRCVTALQSLEQLLQNQRFNIKLNLLTGTPQPDEDVILLTKLRSRSNSVKALAILDTIYSIRCNMFHGHKGFHEVQLELLIPITTLLERICTITWQKLSLD